MKKKDILIIFILILIAGLMYMIFNIMGTHKNASVQVLIDGKIYAEYDLNKEGEYKIETEEGYNVLSIHNSKAEISEASCHNQLCVKEHSISKTGESIICLPHKLVVKIVNSKDTGLDGLAQ